MRGDPVQAGDIRKHHNDVFRPLQVVIPEPIAAVPVGLRHDVPRFTSMVRQLRPDLRNLKMAFSDVEQALALLETVFESEP